MEKEYIEREAALAAIMEKQNEYVDKAWKPVVGGMWQQDELFANAALGCRAACEQVKAITAADVVPVRHAIWRYKTMTVPGGRGQTYAKWSCTACKAKQKERSNYCPNCGAKMDGDGE